MSWGIPQLARVCSIPGPRRFESINLGRWKGKTLQKLFFNVHSHRISQGVLMTCRGPEYIEVQECAASMSPTILLLCKEFQGVLIMDTLSEHYYTLHFCHRRFVVLIIYVADDPNLQLTEITLFVAYGDHGCMIHACKFNIRVGTSLWSSWWGGVRKPTKIQLRRHFDAHPQSSLVKGERRVCQQS